MPALSRRDLLASPAALLAPLALALPPAPLPRAMLRPGRPGALALTAADPGGMLLRAEGIDGAIALPFPTARLAALLPIAGRQVAAVLCPVPLPRGQLSIMAIAGWDGAGLRLLGLEIAEWRGPDGGRLWSRFGGVGNRSRLRIGRAAAVTRPGLPRGWQSWTDYLGWRAGAPLAPALIRPPWPGSWQARLAELRNFSDDLLAVPRQSVPAAWIGAAARTVS